MDIERYIAEIELPDGIASIDCEVHITKGEIEKDIKFFLNFFNYNLESNLVRNDKLTIRQQLDLNFEAEIQTKREDLKIFIMEVLRESYPDAVDIILREIEMD